MLLSPAVWRLAGRLPQASKLLSAIHHDSSSGSSSSSSAPAASSSSAASALQQREHLGGSSTSNTSSNSSHTVNSSASLGRHAQNVVSNSSCEGYAPAPEGHAPATLDTLPTVCYDDVDEVLPKIPCAPSRVASRRNNMGAPPLTLNACVARPVRAA